MNQFLFLVLTLLGSASFACQNLTGEFACHSSDWVVALGISATPTSVSFNPGAGIISLEKGEQLLPSFYKLDGNAQALKMTGAGGTSWNNGEYTAKCNSDLSIITDWKATEFQRLGSRKVAIANWTGSFQVTPLNQDRIVISHVYASSSVRSDEYTMHKYEFECIRR